MADLLFNRPFLAESLAVAAYNDTTQVFGTPVPSLALQGCEIEPEFDTDSKKVGGATEHMLAVMTGGTVKFSNVGYDLALLAVATNLAHSSSGSGTGQVRTADIDAGENYPYVGAMFKMPLDGGGSVIVGFPRAKIMKALSAKISESSEFAVSDMEMMFARLRKADNTLLTCIRYKFYAVDTALPATANDFNAFFGLS